MIYKFISKNKIYINIFCKIEKEQSENSSITKPVVITTACGTGLAGVAYLFYQYSKGETVDTSDNRLETTVKQSQTRPITTETQVDNTKKVSNNSTKGESQVSGNDQSEQFANSQYNSKIEVSYNEITSDQQVQEVDHEHDLMMNSITETQVNDTKKVSNNPSKGKSQVLGSDQLEQFANNKNNHKIEVSHNEITNDQQVQEVDHEHDLMMDSITETQVDNTKKISNNSSKGKSQVSGNDQSEQFANTQYNSKIDVSHNEITNDQQVQEVDHEHDLMMNSITETQVDNTKKISNNSTKGESQVSGNDQSEQFANNKNNHKIDVSHNEITSDQQVQEVDHEHALIMKTITKATSFKETQEELDIYKAQLTQRILKVDKEKRQIIQKYLHSIADGFEHTKCADLICDQDKSKEYNIKRGELSSKFKKLNGDKIDEYEHILSELIKLTDEGINQCQDEIDNFAQEISQKQQQIEELYNAIEQLSKDINEIGNKQIVTRIVYINMTPLRRVAESEHPDAIDIQEKINHLKSFIKSIQGYEYWKDKQELLRKLCECEQNIPTIMSKIENPCSPDQCEVYISLSDNNIIKKYSKKVLDLKQMLQEELPQVKKYLTEQQKLEDQQIKLKDEIEGIKQKIKQKQETKQEISNRNCGVKHGFDRLKQKKEAFSKESQNVNSMSKLLDSIYHKHQATLLKLKDIKESMEQGQQSNDFQIIITEWEKEFSDFKKKWQDTFDSILNPFREYSYFL